MTYNTHKLSSQNHSHIIGRQDSVTGDAIKANDEVVFCSACQSVFLVESWEYMNQKHCNQTETLGFVPAPIPTLRAKKKTRGKNNDDKLIFEIGNSNIKFLYLLFIVPVILSLVGININHWVAGLFVLAAILSYIGLLTIIYTKKLKENNLIRKALRVHKNTVKVLETGIEIQNDKFYSYYEIQKIQYINKSTWDFLVNLSEKYIAIYLKNGEVITQKLPSKRYEQNKPFLFALAWAAQFTELHFYTEVQQELGLVKSIERNYAGKILVLD
ncbi:MAG: hypothetical protein COZ18_05925 [Flexibacter sp. CG_4_10_14_3_um_filter_32_15]|nr:MAG: hypothetical protein COZ18_05925 [Flexibacter sp. CG_4_10_14_3_um_filter_32_15]